MNPLITIINDGDKEFDKQFLLEDSNMTRSGKRLICDPNFAKSFPHSRELALLEGLKKRYEGMKFDLYRLDGTNPSLLMNDGKKYIDLQSYNYALSLAIAELDEVITHLKK